MTRYASNTESTLRRRATQFFSEVVSPTSTTKRFFTIGWSTMQRASRMLMPASANVRESSSSSLALLQPLQQLVRDDARGDLRLAERDVEVVGLAKAHLADHVRQQGRARDLLCGQTLLAKRLLEQLTAAMLGVLAALTREPGAD